MWNGSVWPLVDSADLREIRTQSHFEGGVLTPINNFSFETVRIEAGEEVVSLIGGGAVEDLDGVGWHVNLVGGHR